jgi:cell cycle arrest protein BUB3
VDLFTSLETVIGNHQDAVKCLSYSQSLLFSGSWDKSVKIWDQKGNSLLQTLSMPNKVFSMDTIGNWLVVGLAGRLIHIYDIRQMDEPVQQRESSLKFMTRIVKCMPNEQGYITTSVEGRVAVEYFDPSPQEQSKKYAFKCHRQMVDGAEYIYPVNAIEYHPMYLFLILICRAGTFVSGGGDGVINVWDGQNKKRIRQYPKYPTSIAALSFNCTGTQLAVASSYTFEEGEKE